MDSFVSTSRSQSALSPLVDEEKKYHDELERQAKSSRQRWLRAGVAATVAVVVSVGFTLLFVFEIGAGGAPPYPNNNGFDSATDSFAASRMLARLNYLLNLTVPVVLASRDHVSLVIPSSPSGLEPVSRVPLASSEMYDILRVVSHLPVTAAGMVGAASLALPRSSFVHGLTSFVSQVERISTLFREKSPKVACLSATQQQRQLAICDRTSAFVRGFLALPPGAAPNPAKLLQFTRGLWPDLSKNVDDVSALVVNELMAAMTQFEAVARHAGANLSQSMVSIQTPNVATMQDNVPLQFFADYLRVNLSDTSSAGRLFLVPGPRHTVSQEIRQYLRHGAKVRGKDTLLHSNDKDTAFVSSSSHVYPDSVLLDVIADYYVNAAVGFAFAADASLLTRDMFARNASWLLHRMHGAGQLPMFNSKRSCPFA